MSKKSNDDNQLNPRYVAQIIRRKMTQKSHGDKKKYNRSKEKKINLDKY